MTAPALELAEPLPLQVEVLGDAARFKVWRWGRRASKTRSLLLAGLVGHGPGWPDQPLYPGVLQGWDVVWLARDIPQGKVIWDEEIVPRCHGIRGLKLNHTDHTLTVRGAGRLHIRSAVNIESVRGVGARLKGLVMDEGAHFDLGYAWKRVLRATLMDNAGWAIFASTSNSGHDGNAERIVPSFFNRLCLQVMAGERGPDWKHWHKTAADNPVIHPQELQALIAEYPSDSPELAEEVYAELIEAGGGCLFGYLDKAMHQTAPVDGLPDTNKVGAFDWGWTSPAATLWIETSHGLDGPPESRIYREWWPTQTLPQHFARAVCEVSKAEGVSAFVADAAITSKGDDGSPSVYEQMLPVFHDYKIPLIPVPKGPNSVRNSTQLLHTYLWHANGLRRPLLRISAACPQIWQELRTLQRGNPKERITDDPNIPAPHHPRHGFDALRYWAMSRPEPAPVDVETITARDPFRLSATDPLSLEAIYRERAVTLNLPVIRDLSARVPETRSPWTQPQPARVARKRRR